MTKTRFIEFSEREFLSTIHNFYSDYIDEYLAKVKHAKWNNLKWKGMTLMKDPMSLSIYQQLFQDLKPKTILEFGTFEGGAALWMRDLMDCFNLECDIHTFDINEERVKLTASDKINFHQLDNHKIKVFVEANKSFFQSLQHPILVIEDSHENAHELLSTIDQFLVSGDYIVVDDTLSQWKHDMLELFMENNKYLVDTHYCDFWGYNNSWNVNSFLKKV